MAAQEPNGPTVVREHLLKPAPPGDSRPVLYAKHMAKQRIAALDNLLFHKAQHVVRCMLPRHTPLACISLWSPGRFGRMGRKP